MVPFGVFIGLVCGFVFGKYHERWEWSKLIAEGKLPKPKGK